MKNVLITILCLSTISSFAQTEIKIEDAMNHVGDSVKICSKIFGGKYLESSKGSPTLLNVGGYYPNAPLTLLIWDDIRKQFPKAPEEYYKDLQVCITGRINLYKDKPEIIITDKSQIQEGK